MTVRLSTGYVSRIHGAQSFNDIFDGGCIQIRTGPQAETADAPAAGALIAVISRNGLPWSPGDYSAGLRFSRAERFVVRRYEDDWRLAAGADGVPGHFRLIGAGGDDGSASAVMPRIDGAIGTSIPGDPFPEGDIQMILPVAALTSGMVIQINQWVYNIP